MKRELTRFVLPAIGLCFIALAADVHTDYNHKADFSRYHTSSKPEKNERKLEDAVGDMFKHFPPKERG